VGLAVGKVDGSVDEVDEYILCSTLYLFREVIFELHGVVFERCRLIFELRNFSLHRKLNA
jgi:hypothetical protein